MHINLSELLLIGLVALIVIKPAHLPVVLQRLGRWYAKCQQLIHTIKQEVTQTIQQRSHHD